MKKFFAKNKLKCLLSSLILLVPMLVGLVLWNKLPDAMAIHWGADGVNDGTGSRAFGVFGLPLITLALHWLCIIATAADPQNRDQTRKATGLIFWIMPFITLFMMAAVYAAALGMEIGAEKLVLALMAAMFLIFGNYLPKIKQNTSLGIKCKWTLASEENWNRTHRVGGRVWVACGAVLLIGIFLPIDMFIPVLLAAIVVSAIVPMVYSYMLFRKQKANGEIGPLPPKSKYQKIAGIIGATAGIGVIALAAVLMVTGNIEVELRDTSFKITASYYDDIVVYYDAIDSIELRDTDDPGRRTNGFGSPRLSMGRFNNEEFGYYTRYTYTGNDACIVLKQGENTLVIGGKNDKATINLYETLKPHIN